MKKLKMLAIHGAAKIAAMGPATIVVLQKSLDLILHTLGLPCIGH